MFSLFKKEKFKIVSPLDGQLILLKDVPDSVFSQKLMGDGFAIIPQSQVVVSPISGVAESVFPTGHAVGIKTKDGRNVENITVHLTERIIGTHEWMAPGSSKDLKKRLDHKGASVESVRDALQNPEKIAEVKKRINQHTGEEEESVQYYGKSAIVSFNITTGTIIQTEGR